MAKFIALLRAVNVGGTGKLAMADLKSICADAGFERIETYIASGNVGQSKLVIPAAKIGTARNMNTVAKLVAMSS
jgi:uncharacterized protein (DUF1697 family)